MLFLLMMMYAKPCYLAKTKNRKYNLQHPANKQTKNLVVVFPNLDRHAKIIGTEPRKFMGHAPSPE